MSSQKQIDEGKRDRFHWIIEWLGLEGTLKTTELQPFAVGWVANQGTTEVHSISLFKRLLIPRLLQWNQTWVFFASRREKHLKKKKPQVIHSSAFFYTTSIWEIHSIDPVVKKELQDPLTRAHLHREEPFYEIMSSWK